MRHKPRGHIGYIELGSDPRYRTVSLPETKEEIEDWVLARALAATAQSRQQAPFPSETPPKRNPENLFDFTVPSEGRDQYLDLMEIVILPVGATGYESGGASYFAEDMATAILGRINAKRKRYGRPSTLVHLLLYATDWRFQLDESVTEPLALQLAREPHGFASLCYFSPDSVTPGQFLTLFPLPAKALEAFAAKQDAARARGIRRMVLVIDPRSVRLERKPAG